MEREIVFLKKKFRRYENNRIFIWTIIVALFLQLIYRSMASSNVPLMDYWKYINMFVERMFTEGITFWDIWQNDGIHRSPLQFMYFLLNVRFFHLNSQIEIYLGAILTAVTSGILYKVIKKETRLSVERWFSGLAGIGIIIILYDMNQWEMITQQFALSFSSRQVLFLVSMILTNNYLKSIESAKKYTFELGVLYIFVIASVGGGYFPAYVFAIFLILILDFWVRKNEFGYKYLKEYLILLFFLILGSYIYLHGIISQNISTMATDINIINFIIDFLLGVITMSGVCIIGTEFSTNTVYIVGTVVLFLCMLSLVIYIKGKFYKQTYIPIAFYGYSFGAMGLIYLGRRGLYGNSYAFSSRYVCETVVMLLGLLWILLLYVSNSINRSQFHKITLKSGLILCIVISILCGILISDYKEWKIAPYRKIYGENLIENIMDIDYISEEDFMAFQASESSVRDGIEVMKKYELGIFYKNNK